MITRIPYDANGYLNMGELFPHVLPYTWIWGGRGIGKTYGVLKDCRLDNPRKFVLMRRTQTQIDMLWKPMFNPFNAIDNDCGTITTIVRDGKIGMFYEGEIREDGTVAPVGLPIGYALALSVIHNVRGIDLSDVEIVVYDEFIPERHERPIKDEYNAFLNAMETIGRNRELQGRPALQFIGLTNSNTLGNPYFLGMGVIRTVSNMIKRGTEIWTNPDRGIMLVNILRSPISEAKKNTSLYRMAGEGSFSDMALGNDYSLDVCTRPGTFPLAEVKPLCAVGEICVYQHKALPVYYVSSHTSGSPERYNSDETSLLRFRRDWWTLWAEYLGNNIVFQDILCEILWKKYFGS